VAPLAVSETLLPLQIAGVAGVTITTGIGFTVNAAVEEITDAHIYPAGPFITTS
jgi:hypothetical protein